MSADKNVLIDIWLISLLADRMVAGILEDVSLSVEEFAIYGLISDLAPMTSADLVRATGLSPTTVSSLVRRCEARGERVSQLSTEAPPKECLSRQLNPINNPLPFRNSTIKRTSRSNKSPPSIR
jgi:hypothetical protein